MSAGWVAASVRARAMTRRRLGRAAVVRLAASPSTEAAVSALAQTTYGHQVRVGQSLSEAQRAVVHAVAWNVRVLAGWTPREGVGLLRVLMAILEMANVQDHLQRLAGAEPPAPFRLGGLATAWPRLQQTTDRRALRRALAASPWGDPAVRPLERSGSRCAPRSQIESPPRYRPPRPGRRAPRPSSWPARPPSRAR